MHLPKFKIEPLRRGFFVSAIRRLALGPQVLAGGVSANALSWKH